MIVADSASTITAVGVLIVAVITAGTAAFVAWNGRKIHHELKTLNNMTTGEQVDAATLARLTEIPHDERTVAEQEHLDAAPPRDRAQGPDSGIADRLAHVAQETHQVYQAVNGKAGGRLPLYELVEALDIKLDAMNERTSARFDRLEQSVGLPPDE